MDPRLIVSTKPECGQVFFVVSSPLQPFNGVMKQADGASNMTMSVIKDAGNGCVINVHGTLHRVKNLISGITIKF